MKTLNQLQKEAYGRWFCGACIHNGKCSAFEVIDYNELQEEECEECETISDW